MCASIVIAECCFRSDWGSKEVAKKENNLMLLPSDDYYRGKSVLYEGVKYKTYDNWLDFSVDLGDYYVFSKKFNKVLTANNLDQQLDLLPELQEYSKEYCGIIESMIKRFGLWEFDLYF